MSEANRKSKLTMLLMASLITTNLVFASDYKNNVVDVRVNKESNSAVKVTIYTDKPYTEPVVVNKKANNKYVILMPETKSSLKSTPSVSNVSGTVNNVSVNTQAVSGGKGYTKIIITSEKAITVVPKTQTVSPATQTKSTVAQKTQTTKTSSVAKPAVDKNAAALKAKQEQERKLKAQQEAKAKQLELQKAQQEKAKRLAAQKAQQEAAAKRAAEQRAKEQAQKNVAPQTQAVKPIAPKTTTKQPIEILEQEVKTDKNANFVQNSDDPILNKEIQENIEKNKKKIKSKKKRVSIQYANTGNQSVIENIKAVIRDYQNISLWKLLLLASAITFPIVVIMIILGMDKKINKRIDKSFKREEEPVLNNFDDVEEIIEEDVPVKQFNSFEDMLNQVEEPLPSFHEEQLHKAQYEQFQQSVNQPINDITGDVVEAVEPESEPISMEPELVSEEDFNNDFETEDFEHDFVDDEENIVDDVENKIEDVMLPSIEEPAQPYVPDGYLSDFAGVSDKEFFDELVLQSMAENNINGLPEESPADEIFDFMTSNENNTLQSVEQEKVELTKEDNIQKQNLNNQESSVDEKQEDSVLPVQDNVEQELDNNIDGELETSSESEDDLTMLTEVKLSENTGLYLVNYDNFSSLVGHINDDYFVIKKFDDVVNGNIILKQAEKLKDSTRYLVRVGKNKMVVEVSESSMNRLLDL